ncbi:MAG: hypothetical protein JSW39_08305 [Desulfobacterales bacterium]|nr:MAG: hypothetical protein JSW39_08305 [Desulfobacterales bacterium]
MKRPPEPIVYFATALSLVTLGDSLLYTILPSYYPHLGLTPLQVGILLSVNRWIRSATNHWAESCYRRYSAPRLIILAFLTGAAVAAVYGLAKSFIVFLAARILWGVAFSFLRQAGLMTAVYSGSEAHLGERMGYFRGINALWRTVGLTVGGFIHDRLGFTPTLLGLSLFSLVAVPLGIFSQKGLAPTKAVPVRTKTGKLSFGVIVGGFTAGLVGPGILMSTLGLVLKEHLGNSVSVGGYAIGVATLTGFLLGFRWFIDGIGSPVLGAAADRAGRQRSISFLFASITVLLVAASLLTLPLFLIPLICAFFVCATALMTLLSAQAGQNGPRSVASFSTAVDLGMSVGPLVGWSIAQLGWPTNSIFLTAGVIYGIGAFIAVSVLGFKPDAGRFGEKA